MSVKQKTLEVLENHRGEYISGGELASSLEVSRNAVWKAIKSLEQEGYAIDAVKNRGYRLEESNDILSEQSIQKYLNESKQMFQFQVEKCVRSTNELLKEQAMQGAKEGTVLVAEEQTCGKGKTEREFYSPKGSGIYMSILLRPQISMKQGIYITTAAAVAVAEAIETVSGRKSDIVWVNDIYCDGKKVSGILTEATYKIETNEFDYVVMGIGVHVKAPEQEKHTIQFTESVFEQTQTDIRSQLIAQILMKFWRYYEELSEMTFLEEYKKRSCLIGKTVEIERKQGMQEAKVQAVNDQCHLIVELEDGSNEELSAGTVHMYR